MALIKTKPTSPGRRFVIKVVDPELHKGAPHRPLLVAKPKSTGRNSYGRITSWQRGGGHKRQYRLIDWKREKFDVPGEVERLEYDPNRSANIALIRYKDGERGYIIAPKGLSKGHTVLSGRETPVTPGNAMPIRHMPIGSTVHCIELKPGKGAQLARSAGCSAQILAREGEHATLRLKSGEMRLVPLDCRATFGEVGNSEHNLRSLGKAGASRWRGRRPLVRGVAMNPVDHPLGGGEGRTSGGRPPCTPWGKREGIKTRRNKRTNKMIIRRRKTEK